MQKKELTIKSIILSFITFIVIWTIWVILNSFISVNEYMNWGIGFTVHVICWPMFALFFIKKYDDNLNVSLYEMIHNKPKIKILLPLLLFAVIYNIGVFFLDSDGFKLEMKIYDLIITTLTVGIFEESLFRGWFLNAISRFTSERKANLISSLLFVFAHYPSYIFHGIGFVAILQKSIMLYVLGLLFGLAFRKTRSIWTGAIFHSFWDLISFVM